MAIEKGTKAPDFTLKSKSTGDVADVTLSSNFGSKNTVLLFTKINFENHAVHKLNVHALCVDFKITQINFN